MKLQENYTTTKWSKMVASGKRSVTAGPRPTSLRRDELKQELEKIEAELEDGFER